MGSSVSSADEDAENPGGDRVPQRIVSAAPRTHAAFPGPSGYGAQQPPYPSPPWPQPPVPRYDAKQVEAVSAVAALDLSSLEVAGRPPVLRSRLAGVRGSVVAVEIYISPEGLGSGGGGAGGAAFGAADGLDGADGTAPAAATKNLFAVAAKNEPAARQGVEAAAPGFSVKLPPQAAAARGELHLLILLAPGEAADAARFSAQAYHIVARRAAADVWRLRCRQQCGRFRDRTFVVRNLFGVKDIAEGASGAAASAAQAADAASKECVICLTEEKSTAVLPCMHFCLCQACARVLRANRERCPICREPASEFLQLDGLAQRNAAST